MYVHQHKRAVLLLDQILQSGNLTPIHAAITKRWLDALVFSVTEDGKVPTESLVFGLPAEVRALLGLLIAGDSLVWPDLENEEVVDQSPAQFPAPPRPAEPEVPAAAARMLQRSEKKEDEGDRLEHARQRLRELAERHPDAVLEVRLEAALASTDPADVEAEILDLTMRALS